MDLIKLQFFILLGGTAFAWFNTAREFIAWSNGKKCKTGCPVDAKNPFLTPCFWGAVFFTVALLLNPFTFNLQAINSL